MSEHVFKQGDVVYLENGAKAQFVAKMDTGHSVEYLVLPFWRYEDGHTDEDGEEFLGSDVQRVMAVHPAPPVPALESRCAEILVAIDSAEARLEEMGAAIRAAESEYRSRLTRLAKINPLLENIEDVITGKITHLVWTAWYAPEIRTIEEALLLPDGERDWQHKHRLLSLYGSTKGDLSWRVSRYWDGSGMDSEVIPCTSEAEALEKIKGIIERELVARNAGGYNLGQLLEAADKYGVPVPVAVRKKSRDELVKGLRANLKQAEQQYNDAKKALEQAEAK